MERLGVRLREVRERAKLSQEAVGERAGFTGKYIGEIEKGVRDVPLSTLRAVVESGLGLELDTIFGERPHRRVAIDRVLARDVELTAELLSGLPLKMRRPLVALVEVMSNTDHAARAAERSGPKWRKPRSKT
jgi:transcriptional regulator with XRE-family HTH domain